MSEIGLHLSEIERLRTVLAETQAELRETRQELIDARAAASIESGLRIEAERETPHTDECFIHLSHGDHWWDCDCGYYAERRADEGEKGETGEKGEKGETE